MWFGKRASEDPFGVEIYVLCEESEFEDDRSRLQTARINLASRASRSPTDRGNSSLHSILRVTAIFLLSHPTAAPRALLFSFSDKTCSVIFLLIQFLSIFDNFNIFCKTVKLIVLESRSYMNLSQFLAESLMMEELWN